MEKVVETDYPSPEFNRAREAREEAQLRAEVYRYSQLLGEELFPLSVAMNVAFTAQELAAAFPERWEIFTLVRDNRPSTSEITALKSRLQTLNRLATYLVDHQRHAEARTLKDNQLPVMEALQDFFESGHPAGYVKLPTGSGKTVIFTELIEALRLRSLIIVPRTSLINQTLEEISKYAADIEAGQVHGQVRRLKRRRELSREVVVMTYQSLIKQLAAGEVDPTTFELLILDEGHKALGPKSRETIEQFAKAKKIGFTATPEYSPEKSLEQLLQEEIYAMAIPEAVSVGMLCSFSVILAETEVDLSEVPVNNGHDYSQTELAKAVNIQSRNEAAVQLYRQSFMGEAGYVFCVGIDHAEEMARLFTEHGIPAEAVSSRTSAHELEAINKRFKQGKTQLLCNADLLIEGDNRPRATVCLNLRPTYSRVMAEQRAGRVLRNDPFNPDKLAYVIDFVDQGLKRKTLPVLFAEVAEGTAFKQGRGRVGTGEETQADPEWVEHSVARFTDLRVPGLKVTVNPQEVLHLVQQLMGEKYQAAPRGFYTINGMADVLGIPRAKIQQLVSRLALAPAGTYLDPKGNVREHYQPEAFFEIRELLEKLSTPPEGWQTAAELATRYKKSKSETVKLHLERAVADHPEWKGEYFDANGFVVDYYDPQVIALVKEKIAFHGYPPEGWVTINDFTSGGMNHVSFARWLQPFRELHPEYFKVFTHPKTNSNVIFISPELIQRYWEEHQAPPAGWQQPRDVAEQVGVKSKDTILKWMKEGGFSGEDHLRTYTSPRNKSPALFVSPEAIAWILEHHKPEYAPPGWLEPIEISEKLGLPNSSKVVYWVTKLAGEEAVRPYFSRRFNTNVDFISQEGAAAFWRYYESLPPYPPAGWFALMELAEQASNQHYVGVQRKINRLLDDPLTRGKVEPYIKKWRDPQAVLDTKTFYHRDLIPFIDRTR